MMSISNATLDNVYQMLWKILNTYTNEIKIYINV